MCKCVGTIHKIFNDYMCAKFAEFKSLILIFTLKRHFFAHMPLCAATRVLFFAGLVVCSSTVIKSSPYSWWTHVFYCIFFAYVYFLREKVVAPLLRKQSLYKHCGWHVYVREAAKKVIFLVARGGGKGWAHK